MAPALHPPGTARRFARRPPAALRIWCDLPAGRAITPNSYRLGGARKCLQIKGKWGGAAGAEEVLFVQVFESWESGGEWCGT